MDALLLDTTVASFMHPAKRETATRLLYAPYLRHKHLLVAFQTVAELYRWADERGWGTYQRSELDRMLDLFTVVGYSSCLAKEWAKVMCDAKRLGSRLECGDGWIAASAIHYEVPLVSHDRDFARLSLPNLTVVSHI